MQRHQTKGELIYELNALRRRVAELEGPAQNSHEEFHGGGDEAHRHARDLELLTKLTRSLTPTLEPEVVTREILEWVRVFIPGAAGRLWAISEDGQSRNLVGSIGVEKLQGEYEVQPWQGLANLAISSKKPVISPDIAKDPRYLKKEWAQSEGLVTCIQLPLVHRDQIYGNLAIFTRHRYEFSGDEVNLLEAFAVRAAAAIANSSLYSELMRKTERLEGLNRTSAAIVGTLNLEEALQLIVEEAAKLLKVDGTGLRLLEGDRLVLTGRYGLAENLMLTHSIGIGESISGQVAQENRPITVNDVDAADDLGTQHRAQILSRGVRSYLGVPVRYRDRLVGVLIAFGTSRRRFSKEEINLVTSFADHAAIAIENSRLYRSAEQEITERKRTEGALQASENRFRALYDDTPAMFFTLDENVTILSVNSFGAEQLGYRVDELIGRSASTLYLQSDRATIRKHLATCLEEPGTVKQWELPKVRKDGNLLWTRETARVVQGTESNPTVLLAGKDVTESHKLSEQLSYQASHDVLTGLVNRRAFEARLQRVLEMSDAQGSRHALCYIDLDQFKVINDTCGHVAGDELLRQLGTLLKDKVRKRDTLARLGGDEFGVLMEHCSLLQAERVAVAFREGIEEFRFVWEDKAFSVGASIGLVPITQGSGSITRVLSAADAACYAAKDKGRNRIHVYREDDAELAKRHEEMQWVSRVHWALEESRFRLCFQPIVPLATRPAEGAHYELLLRMEDEEGSIVHPSAFLTAAERYDLGPEIDRWVIRTAFEWLASHPEHLERLYLCEINLSGQSLGESELLALILGEFDDTKIPPGKICFEVTETAAIANLTSATSFIRTLKERGCKFALDDFGSGLSSFAYLKNLPVDLLKIDGLFVRDIVEDPIDLAMVRSINEIAHAMGKQTIAEFVENEAILEKLKLPEIGVDYVQGYATGRPRPISELL
jgi:diguanylate cyclase (GGDEF)-like protein/PAS domain S-box-containing protein